MPTFRWPRRIWSNTGGPPSEPPHDTRLPPWPKPPPRRNSCAFLSSFPPACGGLRSLSSKWPSGVESPLRSNQTVSR